MKAPAGTAKKRPKAHRRVGTKKGGKLIIREIIERDGDYSWTTFMVQGWREDGMWKRKKFRDRSDAQAFLALKQVELLNGETKLRQVTSTLSLAQVQEAEAAFNRLMELERDDVRAGEAGRRHSLLAAVEYYAKQQGEGKLMPVKVADARRAFLIAKENEGVRARSLVQLDSTLKQFERSLSDEMTVGEVAQDDVDRFLKSLRSRDGKHKAARKTWNGYRADVHSFYAWAGEQLTVDENGRKLRWTHGNPASAVVKFKLEREMPEALTVKQAAELMRHVAEFEGGRMVPYFALALFAGLRPGPDGELHKLALHRDKLKLIDLQRAVIHIQPEISKTGQYRQVIIRDNLALWLARYGLDLLPPNHDRMAKAIRRKFGLGHDVLRHTFFSMHVAAFKSVGEAALEGGNTEQVLKKHYLNLASYQEGAEFWTLMPPQGRKEATNVVRIAPAKASKTA